MKHDPEAVKKALAAMERQAELWGHDDPAKPFMEAVISALRVIGQDAETIRERLSESGMEKLIEAAAMGARKGVLAMARAQERRTGVMFGGIFACVLLVAVGLTYWMTWRDADHWSTMVRSGMNTTMEMSLLDGSRWLQLIRANPEIDRQLKDCDSRTWTDDKTGLKVCLLAVYLQERAGPGAVGVPPGRYPAR